MYIMKTTNVSIRFLCVQNYSETSYTFKAFWWTGRQMAKLNWQIDITVYFPSEKEKVDYIGKAG